VVEEPIPEAKSYQNYNFILFAAIISPIGWAAQKFGGIGIIILVILGVHKTSILEVKRLVVSHSNRKLLRLASR